MKKQIVILAAALLLMGLTFTFGQSINSNTGTSITKEATANYINGLNNGNQGIKLSCAYFIGEYKISEGMIPLMRMLHNDTSEAGRIMAALALTKLGSGQSIYAVKQAAKFDKSQRVRDLCLKFYYHQLALEESSNDNLE